jgi:Fur family ferric uptake transcriptional regulator
MERQTRQRQAIRRAVEDAGAPVSPKEIHELSQRSVAGIGMATIYRAIKTMLDAGELVQVDVPGEAPRYEAAGKSHHHHFHCRKCQRMFELEGCPGDFSRLIPRGFTLEDHNLLLSGVCAGCGRDGARA